MNHVTVCWNMRFKPSVPVETDGGAAVYFTVIPLFFK